MKEKFVTYELAIKLKSLGFRDKCIARYTKSGQFSMNVIANWYDFNGGEIIGFISAPLWQDVLDWLRRERYLYILIIPTIHSMWTYKVITVVDGMIEVPPYKQVNAYDYSTYEEARLFAVTEIINELTEQENETD